MVFFLIQQSPHRKKKKESRRERKKKRVRTGSLGNELEPSAFESVKIRIFSLFLFGHFGFSFSFPFKEGAVFFFNTITSLVNAFDLFS